MLQRRVRVKPITAALNTDYNETLPSGTFRALNMKFSGIMTASGAGTAALDGAFNLAGRIEARRGSDLLIGLHGPDWKHISGTVNGGYPETLATIATGNPFLAQGLIKLDRLCPHGGVDNRAGDVTFSGRIRGATNLGTTVTALSTNKLRFSGDTDDFPNGGDCMEPRISSNTIDTSAASADLNTRRQIASRSEVIAALAIRTFDASVELSDPNTCRSDGMIREIRLDLERNGSTSEVGRWSWGEAKQITQQHWGVTGATGQVQTGFVLIPILDKRGPLGRLGLVKGDSLIVRIDTVGTIEDEFTALTPAAGDLAVVTFCNFVPRGPGVDAALGRRAA